MDPYQIAQNQFNSVITVLRKDYANKKSFDKAVKKLGKPQSFIEKNLKVGGKSYKAFRSQHNDALGPFKGGIRFHQNVTKEEVMALSMWMSAKAALMNLPYGGAKGGVVVNPKELSLKDLKSLSQKYATEFADYIGPWVDVPAPDVNTDAQIMAWMLEVYEGTVGHHAPATFTGKPLALGGSLGREEATGQGGVFVLQNYAKKERFAPEKTILAVQGFGNVGYWFSRLASALRFKIVLVSDSSGGVYNQKGLNIIKIKLAKDQYGSFVEANKKLKLSFIKPEEVPMVKCDILVPAALENAITRQNANRVKAEVILELANGPTTPEAEEILIKKGVEILPDILCNSGGVTVSYFEWVQNLSSYRWSFRRVNRELKVIMDRAFEEVYALAKTKKTTFRKAAYLIAVKRIIDAMIIRGRV